MLNLQIGAGTLYIADKKFLNKAKFAYLKTKTNKRTQGDRLIITLVLFILSKENNLELVY